MGIISNTVTQWMKRFRQKQMKSGEVTQPGWEDAADYIREWDMMYRSSELSLLAPIHPRTDDDPWAPVVTTFWELMECLDIVSWIWQMLQGTSRPGSSHIRIGSGKPQSNTSIFGFPPTAGTKFASQWDCVACWSRKLWPRHIASPANHHTEIRFRQRQGGGSCVMIGIESQIDIFYIITQSKAMCVLIWLCVSFFFILVTKLWDMIIHLCMCKGRTHHAKDIQSLSGCNIANTFDFCLPIAVKWESNSYISDEIY